MSNALGCPRFHKEIGYTADFLLETHKSSLQALLYTCSLNSQLSEDLFYHVLDDNDNSMDDVSLKVRVYSYNTAIPDSMLVKYSLR